MVSMDHLYNDPDWMLQAGLGDIEFEQDMYDDIMYGKPAHLPEWGRDQVREQWPSQWEPLADYDELALMGLRKHTMEGPMRYIYDDEQKKRRKKVYDIQGKDVTGYMGQVDVDDPFDPDDNPRTRMDIDLKKILITGQVLHFLYNDNFDCVYYLITHLLNLGISQNIAQNEKIRSKCNILIDPSITLQI